MRKAKIALVAAVLLLVAMSAAPGAAAAVRPSSPLPEQWWFVTWGVKDLLWPHSRGRGVVVAVVDTGVQADLPDLAGVVLPGVDYEHNTNGHTDFDDEKGGHGTAMASAIAAQGTHTGFIGVAPEAKILPIAVRSSLDIIRGIRHATDRGAKVINISMAVATVRCPPQMQEAIRYAIDRDVVVVAAAGNDGDTINLSQAPANCLGVLAVGASTVDNKPWPHSQRQPYVDIAAPGGVHPVLGRSGRIGYSSGGTSLAAALTSGAIALVRAKYPQMTNREVVRQVIASAKDIGPPGKDDASGHGLWRPRLILTGRIPPNTGNPVFAEYDQWMAAQQRAAQQRAARTRQRKSLLDQLSDWAELLVPAAVAVPVVSIGMLRDRRRRRRAVPAPAAPPGFPPPVPPPAQVWSGHGARPAAPAPGEQPHPVHHPHHWLPPQQ